MNNMVKERVIYIKDVLFVALYQWKRALIVGIVLALVLGGAMGGKTLLEALDTTKQRELALEYAAKLEAYEQQIAAGEQELESIGIIVDSQREYMKKSILLNLDAGKVNAATVQMYVVAGSSDVKEDALAAYRGILTGGEALKSIVAQVDMESWQLNELVTVTFSNEEAQIGNVLSIDVRGRTAEEARKIMDLLLQYLEDVRVKVSSAVGGHELKILSRHEGVRADRALAGIMAEEADRMADYLISAEAVEYAIDELDGPEDPTSSIGDAVKKGIVFAVIGGVLGVALVMGIAVVGYAAGDVVFSERTVRDQLAVSVLGNLVPPESKTPKAIDRFLRKLEGRAVENDEKTVALAKANVRNYGAGVSKMLVCGDASAESIASLLSGAGVPMVAAGNLLHCARAVQLLEECDGVLLVLKCHHSRYSEADRQVQLLQDLGKRTVGCIVIE